MSCEVSEDIECCQLQQDRLENSVNPKNYWNIFHKVA